MTDTPNPPTNTTAVIIAVCVVFVATLGAVVAVFVVAPDSPSTQRLVTGLLATLAPTIAALAVLVQVRGVQAAQIEQSAQIDRVAEDTYALTNGLLDSKVRAGVAEVMRDDLLDPEHAETVARDKILRDVHERDSEPPK